MQELSEKQAIDALYNGCPIEHLKLAPVVKERFNRSAQDTYSSLLTEPFFSEQFFTPEEYLLIDLKDFFYSKVKTDDEQQRVDEELILFEASGNIEFLRYLIYLSDVIKENNIVIGVGRGSSVSVFLLFLLGLHKVNSLQYGLEYTDFFKIKENKDDYN